MHVKIPTTKDLVFEFLLEKNVAVVLKSPQILFKVKCIHLEIDLTEVSVRKLTIVT